MRVILVDDEYLALSRLNKLLQERGLRSYRLFSDGTGSHRSDRNSSAGNRLHGRSNAGDERDRGDRTYP